jgi:hypothetical protein
MFTFDESPLLLPTIISLSNTRFNALFECAMFLTFVICLLLLCQVRWGAPGAAVYRVGTIENKLEGDGVIPEKYKIRGRLDFLFRLILRQSKTISQEKRPQNAAWNALQCNRNHGQRLPCSKTIPKRNLKQTQGSKRCKKLSLQTLHDLWKTRWGKTKPVNRSKPRTTFWAVRDLLLSRSLCVLSYILGSLETVPSSPPIDAITHSQQNAVFIWSFQCCLLLSSPENSLAGEMSWPVRRWPQARAADATRRGD